MFLQLTMKTAISFRERFFIIFSVPTSQKIGMTSEFHEIFFCNTYLGDDKVFLLSTTDKGI